MNKLAGKRNLLLLGIALALIWVAWFVFSRDNEKHQPVTDLVVVPQSGSLEGFERATGPRVFEFPADHGPHPEFQTEWWYYTGNLMTEDGRHFGYQLTFFRRALTPSEIDGEEISGWRTNQVYLAHFALSDISSSDFYYNEKISRGGAGLAGAQGSPVYKVWLEDWSVEQSADGPYRLTADAGEYGIDLELIDKKGPILQGDRGYSQKGDEPGNASYYISQTRLESRGRLRVGESTYLVNGLSWMDHEFSTSALGVGQVGWDWFSIQLDDGSEIMLFSLRNEDPDTAPYMAGTMINADGTTRTLKHDDIRIVVEDTWTSPLSKAEYPAKWRINITVEEIEMTVIPMISNQELDTFFTYWEGAVRVSGVKGGNEVSGFGYVELTGYAGSMEGQF